MKKGKSSGDSPVTLSQLNKALNKALDKAFDKRLKPYCTEARSQARYDALSRSIANLERNMKDQFNTINNHIDAFMKRTEDNRLEIIFLGRQHDDLAKYCTAA